MSKRLPQTTVYKVVYKNAKGQLVSAFLGKEEEYGWGRYKHCARTYAIGKRTLPIPGTGLFVFTSYDDAARYAKSYGVDFFVYEATATSVKQSGMLVNGHLGKRRNFTFDLLRDIFTSGQFMEVDEFFYSSCAVATSVTLTKMIS